MRDLQCFSREQTCDMLQLGRFKATYDRSIIDIYRLKPLDKQIIFPNNGFICIIDILNR